MPSAASLIAKVDKLLRKYNLTDRVVSKRFITRIGGDDLIGRPASVTFDDTVLDPQPQVRYAIDTLIRTGRNNPLVVGGEVAMTGDYICTLSPTAITKAELSNKNVTFLFTDAAGGVEERVVISFDPVVMNGTDVVFDVLTRFKSK